jgi:hypothetical protein
MNSNSIYAVLSDHFGSAAIHEDWMRRGHTSRLRSAQFAIQYSAK